MTQLAHHAGEETMHIRRIQNDAHPFPTAGGPHSVQSNGRSGESESVEKSRPNAVSSPSGTTTEEVSYLLDRLRLLPAPNDDALQLAKARFESGELFTREAAESSAISSLRDFVF